MLRGYYVEGALLKRSLTAFVFIFVFLGLAGLVRADIYKYVDENGVLHFTNVPKHSAYEWVMRESRDREKSVSRAHLQIRYDRIISKASRRYDVDPALIKAVIEVESDFNPRAKSKAGAKGLMQLMPATAKGLGVTDIYDPTSNIEGGVKHLKSLLTRFKRDVPLALAAYNAGEKSVRKYGTIPPYKETQGYVARVLEYRKKYIGTFSK